MEKTLAREIYKRMELGKEYTTSALFDLVEDVYYKHIDKEMYPGQRHGKPVNAIISSEMWKVVKFGYADTWVKEETLALVRGLKFGSKSTASHIYKFRYWKRVK